MNGCVSEASKEYPCLGSCEPFDTSLSELQESLLVHGLLDSEMTQETGEMCTIRTGNAHRMGWKTGLILRPTDRLLYHLMMLSI